MSNYREFKKEAMSMPTKENFVAIADILTKQNASDEMIKEFADYFQRTNPKFDYEQFMDYINSKQGEGPVKRLEKEEFSYKYPEEED